MDIAKLHFLYRSNLFPVENDSFSLPFLIFPGYLQVPGARGGVPSWQRFHHLKTIPICSMMLVYLLVGALEHEFDFPIYWEFQPAYVFLGKL